jgi:DcuC family C4-dicarboxylate transporter
MLQVFLTLLMIVIVIYAIVKKLNAITAIFAVSLIALFIWTLLTGKSLMGKETIGSAFLDVYEFLYSTIKTQIAGNVLVCMVVLGYVGFMNHLKASDAFTMVIAKPLSKIKSPYILTSLLLIVGALLKLVIPSAIAVVSLLFAILYPVLLKCGSTRATICTALVMSSSVTWGPADAGVMLTQTLMAPHLSVTDFFIDYQFPIAGIALVVMSVVFYFTSKMYDKKENAKGLETGTAKETKSLKELGIPKFYAILPLFPLLSIVLFSGKVFPITMSTVGATLLALVTAFVIHLLTNIKKFGKAFNDIVGFFNAMGDYMAKTAFIIIAGTFFSSALTKVGGMTIIVEAFNKAGGSVVVLSILGALLAFAVTACTVSYLGNLNIFVPFFANIAQITGFDGAALGVIANNACGLGTGVTPASATMLLLSSECDVPFPTILKRNIIPLLSGLTTIVILTFVFH